MMKQKIGIMLIVAIVCVAIVVPVFANGNRTYTVKTYDGTPVKEGRVLDAISCYGFEAKEMEDLEKKADIIIRGKILPNPEVVHISNPADSVGTGYTLTKVEVMEVFAGDIEETDVIVMVEYCFEVDYDGELHLVTSDGYLPSEPEKEYILFLCLNRNEDSFLYGMYNGILSHMGRYPIPEVNEEIVYYSLEDQIRAIPNSKFNVLSSTNTTIYRNVYNEVIDKYIKNN